MLPVGLSYRVRRACHRVGQLPRCVVSHPGSDPGQVVANLNPLAEDVAEIPVLDAPSEIPLKDDLGEDIVQADLVSPVGRSRETDVKPRIEMIINLPICTGCCMMAFIRDNHVKIIWRKFVQPSNKALDARNNNFLAVAFIFCNFKPNGAVVVFCWLTNQLLPMRKD